MNDDELTPQAELASAALDGMVTADERAQVEASDALRAEVAGYHTLAARLNDVDVPAQARELAISAALAAFDEVEPAEPTTATPPTAPLRSLDAHRHKRAMMTRWLGGAAAAALVGVVAVGIANRDNASDDGFTAESTTDAKDDGRDADAPGEDAGRSQASFPPSASMETAISLDQWDGAVELQTLDDAVDLFAAADVATTEGAPESTAAPEYSVAADPTPDQPMSTSAGGDALPCVTDDAEGAAPAFFDGQRVVAVATAGIVELLRPDDCVVVATVQR